MLGCYLEDAAVSKQSNSVPLLALCDGWLAKVNRLECGEVVSSVCLKVLPAQCCQHRRPALARFLGGYYGFFSHQQFERSEGCLTQLSAQYCRFRDFCWQLIKRGEVFLFQTMPAIVEPVKRGSDLTAARIVKGTNGEGGEGKGICFNGQCADTF